METMAKKALAIITTHKLTPRSYGGAELYMEKFENALQELEEMDKPYDSSLAKINFLANIEDDEYVNVKENLEMDDNKGYHEALNEIRRKSIAVEEKRKGMTRTRRSNKTKTKGKGKNENHSSKWVPADEWKKMSEEKCQEHINKFRKNKAKKDVPSEVSKPNQLPSQYSSANSTVTEKEKELYEFVQQGDGNQSIANTTMSSHQQRFVTLCRSLNNLRGVGYGQVDECLSSCMERCCCCSVDGNSNDEPSLDTTVDDASGSEVYHWDTWDLFEDYLLDLEKQHIIRIEDDKKIIYLEDMDAEFVYETDRDEEHVDDEETDRRAAFDVHMNKHIIGNDFITEEYESDLYDFIDALFQRNDPRVTKVFVRSSHSNVLTKVPRSVNRAYKMNNVSSDKGKLLIDGGCDTCLVGN